MIRKTLILLPGSTVSEKTAAGIAAGTASALRFPEQRAEEIRTATGEAFRNAVEHGNTEGQRIRVSMTEEPSRLTVRVYDNGAGVPDLDTVRMDDTITKRRKEGRNRTGSGGWGLVFIKNFCDVCLSEKTADGHVLTMIFEQSNSSGQGESHVG